MLNQTASNVIYTELAHQYLAGYNHILYPVDNVEFLAEVSRLSGAPQVEPEPTLEEFQRICYRVAELQRLNLL